MNLNDAFGVSSRLLQKLVEEDVEPLRKYSSFIYGVFDHMHLLNLDKVRKLFSILTRLVLQQNHSDSILSDEMYIIMKKQLGSKSERFEKIGITSAFAVITETLKLISKSTDKTYMKKMLEEMKHLLYLVEKSISSSFAALSLFFEEMAVLTLSANALHYKIIFESIRALSEKYWTIYFDNGSDSDQTSSSSSEIAAEKRFGLSNDTTVSLKLFELVKSSITVSGKSSIHFINVLPSFITFYWNFQTTKSALRNSRGTQPESRASNATQSLPSNLETMLQCTVNFPAEQICTEVLENPASLSCRNLEFLCCCHLGLINYLRELLNQITILSKDGFSIDNERFSVLCSRVSLLNIAQETFMKLLKVTPSYQFVTSANPFCLPETLSFGPKKTVQLPHQVTVVSGKKQSRRNPKASKSRKQNTEERQDADANTVSGKSTQAASQNQDGGYVFTAPGSSENFESG